METFPYLITVIWKLFHKNSEAEMSTSDVVIFGGLAFLLLMFPIILIILSLIIFKGI